MITNDFRYVTRVLEDTDVAAAMSNLTAAGITFSEVNGCGDPACSSCVEGRRAPVGAAA